MTKKLLSILTAAAMLCTMMALPVNAAEEATEYIDGANRPVSVVKTSGDYKYYVREDGTVSLIDYLGYENKTQTENVVVPAEIDGKKVTRLGEYVFEAPYKWDKKAKQRVIAIPSIIKTIELPESITEIGDSAFSYCEKLTKAPLAPQIKEIGDAAFQYCKSLTDVAVPNGVAVINWGTFSGCTSLKSVMLPDSIIEINDSFSECSSLKNLKIPASVKTITPGSFRNSPNLNLTIDPNNRYFTFENGILYHKAFTNVISCVNPQKKIVLSNKTKNIRENAFLGVLGVKEVVLPKGLETIGRDAFIASSIEKVNIPNTVLEIGENAFHNTNLKTLTLPKGVKKVKDSAFSFCKQLTSVTIGDGIKFEGVVFDGCPKLKTYRIGKNVKFSIDSFGMKDIDAAKGYKGVKFYGYKGTSAEKNAKATNKYRKARKQPLVKFIPLTAMKRAKVKGVTAKKYNKSVKKSGARQKIKVYVKKKLLKKGRDYTVSYQNNKKRGKAKIIITGINKYDGVIKRSFKIR